MNSDGKVNFDQIPEDININCNYFTDYDPTRKIPCIKFNHQGLSYEIGLIHNNSYINLNDKIPNEIKDNIFTKAKSIKKNDLNESDKTILINSINSWYEDMCKFLDDNKLNNIMKLTPHKTCYINNDKTITINKKISTDSLNIKICKTLYHGRFLAMLLKH